MLILIELPTWLGDTVMTTPSIENLRTEFPDAKFSFIGPQSSIAVFKNSPNLNKTFIIKKDILNLIRGALNIEYHDIFISFRSSFRSSILKLFINAEKKIKYNKNKFLCGHQVERYNYFVSRVLKSHIEPKELKIYLKSNKDFKKPANVGINPGAKYGSAKRWTKDGFIKVAYELSKTHNIILFGSAGEEDLCNDIKNSLDDLGVKNCNNLAGKTSLDELIDEISKLKLFITGDSGPMHIAAAFQIPTVSIFGPTKANETSQWMNNRSSIIKKDLNCQPCMKRVCPLGHHDCMKKITSKDVINSALDLI